MASKLIVLATATGCIAAAGVGSYLAVRTAPSGLAAPAAVAAPAPLTASQTAPTQREQPTEILLPGRMAATSSPKAVTRQDVPDRELPDTTTKPAVADFAAPAPATTPDPLASEVPASAVATPDAAAQPTATAGPLVDPFEDVEIARESVIGIRIETPISTEHSKVEDSVSARIARDVNVEGRTIIPAGTQVLGHVTVVERGGRVRERARLGVRFTTLVFADRTRVAIDTPAIFREGEAKTGEASAKIGASAVIGGILGGIVGGKRGAAIGGTAGAAGGTAVVMSGDRSEASLATGTTLTLRLAEPLVIRLERR